jgi:hypothetical protein
MGNNNKVCPGCGHKMKQHFIGLQHCNCGISWKKDIGYFERTSGLVFALERRVVKKSKNSIKAKQVPVIRYRSNGDE